MYCKVQANCRFVYFLKLAVKRPACLQLIEILPYIGWQKKWIPGMATNTMIRSGQVLIAEPFMLDPYFKRAVVLLCEHHDEGTLGFILNKNIDMGINDLMSDFPKFDAEIFYGGPVQTDNLHYVHDLGDLLEDSIKIAEGVWWGGDFEQLKFLIGQQVIQPATTRFFVGYSGR